MAGVDIAVRKDCGAGRSVGHDVRRSRACSDPGVIHWMAGRRLHRNRGRGNNQHSTQPKAQGKLLHLDPFHVVFRVSRRVAPRREARRKPPRPESHEPRRQVVRLLQYVRGKSGYSRYFLVNSYAARKTTHHSCNKRKPRIAQGCADERAQTSRDDRVQLASRSPLTARTPFHRAGRTMAENACPEIRPTGTKASHDLHARAARDIRRSSRARHGERRYRAYRARMRTQTARRLGFIDFARPA